MEKQEYLSEEKYQQTNRKVNGTGKIVLIVGILMIVVGIILLIIGFVGFGSSAKDALETIDPSGVFGSFGFFIGGGFLTSFGFFVAMIGGIILFMAHRREIVSYTTQQVMPVAQEGIEKMTPTVGKAAGTISKEVAKGIQEGIQEANEK